jgi:hypothetical protein
MPSPVIAVRVNDEDRERIGRLAGDLRLTRSEYMRLAALGELPASRRVEDRIAELENRVRACERWLELGGGEFK